MCENTLDYYCTTVAAKVRSTFNDLVARMPVCCNVVSSVFIPNPFCAIKNIKILVHVKSVRSMNYENCIKVKTCND